MLSIKSLLNPEGSTSTSISSQRVQNTVTPAGHVVDNGTTTAQSTIASGNGSAITATVAPAVQSSVNYAPTEFSQPLPHLTTIQQKELNHWHNHFKLALPENQQGLIRDHARTLACKGDKWIEYLNRPDLKVYTYEFTKPATTEEEAKTYVIMWEYELGLVRTSNIFWAVEGHNKGSPKVAFDKSQGHDQLCVNLTGGGVKQYGSQGYWVPYETARAICTTFCWHIRWALTPMFGYGFINDCLPPSHDSYKSYLVSDNILAQTRRRLLALKRQTGTTVPARDQQAGNAAKAAPKSQASERSRPHRSSKLTASPARPAQVVSRAAARNRVVSSPSISPKTPPRKLAARKPPMKGSSLKSSKEEFTSLTTPQVQDDGDSGLVVKSPGMISAHWYDEGQSDLIVKSPVAPMVSWRAHGGQPEAEQADQLPLTVEEAANILLAMSRGSHT